MGVMKDLLITIYGGGDDAVAAVQRMGKDWREMLEYAANEVEQLRGERTWIAAGDRVPPPGVEVLTYADCSGVPVVQAASRDEHGGWSQGVAPTHWMPMPRAPGRGQ